MNDWRVRWRNLQGSALYLYSRLVTQTCCLRVEGWENLAAAEKSERPLLWSFWHGQVMPFISFGDRYLENEEFVAIVVGDTRADTLSIFADRLRAQTYQVDMEGNPFAAGRAVLRVVRAMQQGKQSIIAPDGPDGPAFVPKPGVSFLARKAEAALLPLGVWTRHAYQLKRWDRYLVPYPFARIHVFLGKPLYVDRKADNDRLLQQVAAALHKARARAQVLAGVRPWI